MPQDKVESIGRLLMKDTTFFRTEPKFMNYWIKIAMFCQKNLSREGGVELVVKELCTRLVEEDVMSHAATEKARIKNVT